MILSSVLVAVTLACCGEGDGKSTPAATKQAETPVAAGETPSAAVGSEYDEEWAREQVEPYLKELGKILLDQEWNKAYDLTSEHAREGCSRSEFVSKMAGVWDITVEFGADEVIKAELQDLAEGKLTIAFTEITKDRITYKAGNEGKFIPIVREDGKWKSDDPLGQDCASLDITNG